MSRVVPIVGVLTALIWSGGGPAVADPRADDAAVLDWKPTAQEAIVPAGARLELVWNEGEFTEGPVPAADGAILFSDIGNRIMRFDPATGQTAVFREPSGKANGLKLDPDGRLVACEGAAPGGQRRISITEKDGTLRVLADRWRGKRFNSPNDLAIARAGRVYFTDPRYVGDEPRELDLEGVFRVEPDGRVELATRDVQKPNGILVSPDQRTLYLADSNPRGNQQLVTFSIESDGSLTDKRVLVDFGAGKRGIDGMTLDREGRIYAAAGAGGEAGVYVFDPSGKLLALIPTPGDPTNCVFGVRKESHVLYVTAAGPPPNDPNAQRSYGLYRIGLKTTGYHVFDYERAAP